jgi:transcriptional regulator with XRE-family HTH domain
MHVHEVAKGEGVTDVEAGGSPTVLRIMLGSQLRRLREAKGMTREEAGYTIRASGSKMSRLELGRVSFKERDVADLLMLYGVADADRRDALLSLARQANQTGWWHRYSDVLPSWFQAFVGLEEAASRIRTYEGHLIPGLLQTEGYVRALSASGSPTHADEVERLVRLRLDRQRILTRANPPHLWAVVDEAALRRQVGGREVMRVQLEHLIATTKLPNVTLQVMPLRAGVHASEGQPFVILRFAEPELPDVVYLEQLTSALYLDRPEDAEYYTQVMDRLVVQAKKPDETVEMIHLIHADLEP